MGVIARLDAARTALDDPIMHQRLPPSSDLVGIGLYSTAEASALLRLRSQTIRRWMRGYVDAGRRHEPLWQSQVPTVDNEIYLGFRDLQELRVAAAFVAQGLGTRRVREAIVLARDLTGDDHPLSTTKFRSDGRAVFLQLVEADGETRLIDLFRKQYAFAEILEKSLTNLDYDGAGVPTRWWPAGRAAGIVLDPTRAFGQPIEAETSVPVGALVAAARAEGNEKTAARAWNVPVGAIRRAMAFARDHQAAA